MANIKVIYGDPAFMHSQETWGAPDKSLSSCWCDQPVDLEWQRQCLLNCVSFPLWKKKTEQILCIVNAKSSFDIYISPEKGATVKLLCIISGFLIAYGVPWW